MRNALTVDVEDYFQTEAMSEVAPRESWPQKTLRVEQNTWRLLDIFERYQVHATFFFLGWVAGKCPGLVAAAAAAGHEIACHSYWHHPVCRLSPDRFREDTARAKEVIEAAACVRVRGYRAPSFSIMPGMDWAYEILAEMGFVYDSSCHPIRHDLFNNPNAPRLPYRSKAGLLEIPITTWRMLGRNLPVGGGAYLRILPFSFVSAGLSHAAAKGETLMVYLHPWEIDDEQPRLPAGLKSRLRQYTGLKGMSGRLERLLSCHSFTTASEAFAVDGQRVSGVEAPLQLASV
jgi:polysaccharide deacetylase family protein (PEP-CTERM system associated)